MIDDPFPPDWRALQAGVCRLFNDIGLSAEVEVERPTPRGRVVVDVFATDENSVDNITYIVECKNWNSAIPKTVVHAFTTVMQETGANIGYIVSQHGLQSGAEEYTRHTNITGLTYQALQERYFNVWWQRYFCVAAASAADSAHQYVEPFNSFRECIATTLDSEAQTHFRRLQAKYAPFVLLVQIMDIGRRIPQHLSEPPVGIGLYKEKVGELLGDRSLFKANYYRDLLVEISSKLASIEGEFNGLFGRNIFSPET
ncbi:MAG: restriction endonuclease [Immundisolibacter sp.]|uniref:restriction endonuclease n=1 Tax=Immundisolibacter sp. TaxID=1934948 RepID=UPI003D124333